MDSSKTKKKKIVFFSPFSYIWKHSISELQLAKILRRNGFEVNVVGCNSAVDDYCTPMSLAKCSFDSQDKSKVCHTCIRNRKLSNLNRNLEFVWFNNSNRDEVNEYDMLKLNEKLNFDLDGIKVGKLAAYETLINFKKTDFNFNKVEEAHYNASFRMALKTFYWSMEYLKAAPPEFVVIYSPQYVVPGIFASVAEKFGCKVVFIEGSSDDTERYSNIRMWDWNKFGLTQPALSYLDEFSNYGLSKKRRLKAEKYLKAKSNSKNLSVYSSNAKGEDPFSLFDLDRSKKLILLAMSSYDEVFSGVVIGKLPKERMEGEVFSSQIEWLQETIDWALHNPEIQIIIRPHPREFPNKRENTRSNHYAFWNKILANLPLNVRVDHPELNFSLFDYWPYIDALTTGWSSTSIEALAENIPVVTYDKNLPTIPESIHLTGASKEEYFENLLIACALEPTEKFREDALKWISFLSEKGTVFTGGGLQTKPFVKRNKFLVKIFHAKGFNISVKIIDTVFPVTKRSDKRIQTFFDNYANSLYDV